MFNFSKKPKIKFYIHKNRAGAFPPPVPAKSAIPEYYKNASPFTIDDPVIRTPQGGATPTGTFKKCMPFLDALTSGYIIKLHCDVHVKPMDDTGPNFTWTLSDAAPLSHHSYAQVSAIPGATSMPGGIPFKWMSPWHIETDPGYSCLIVQPLNHFEKRWEILPGVVDTDSYNLQINFPFIWKDRTFHGVIERGTPIAQIIPFRRESWQHAVINEDPKQHSNNLLKLSSKVVDAYKTFWWKKKEWN